MSGMDNWPPERIFIRETFLNALENAIPYQVSFEDFSLEEKPGYLIYRYEYTVEEKDNGKD